MFRNLLLLLLLTPFTITSPTHKLPSNLQTFHHVNENQSDNMVSTLIVGSKAAVIVDMPVAVPSAKRLAEWVRKTTDKPLVAAFASHFHPDHYLSAGDFLEEFRNVAYYANERTVTEIIVEALGTVKDWSSRPGYSVENITQVTAIPEAYNFTFFVLPGNEDEPVQIFQPLTGETVDLSFFWIPSIDTVIAADVVYGPEMHLWLSDLQSLEMAQAWLHTLDFLECLKSKVLYPGHGASGARLTTPEKAIKYTRDYVTFFVTQIQAKGPDYYTVAQIVELFHNRFPSATNTVGEHVLDVTARTFGRDGIGPVPPASVVNRTNSEELNGYILQ
ncbi:hypothetical protein RUND412_004644 [Rhizina undulata]